MLALKITQIKAFMNQLLATEDFDAFLMEEATIQTAITTNLDGHINLDFYPIAERTQEIHPYEYQPWSEARQTCFQLIKGKNAPLYFKFVLLLKPDSAQRMLQKAQPDQDFSQVKYLMAAIKFDESGVVLTNGTSYLSFVLNKDADQIWDHALQQFLNAKGIAYEIM